MKISIKGSGREKHISLPNSLMFNQGTGWLAGTMGKKLAPEAVEGISPQAVKAILAELQRVKKRHGEWTLVEVESANGETVTITL